MSRHSLENQGFFVLRTPRMPVLRELNSSYSYMETVELLKHLIRKPEVMEAIYLASPSLYDRVEIYKNDIQSKTLQPKKVSKQTRKLEHSILKYLIRMSTRPTPFGLFSGISLGYINEPTNFISNHLHMDERYTRLDIFFLSALKKHILATDLECSNLIYSPNPSHYVLGDSCRYIESYQSDEQFQYRLSAIKNEEHFQLILSKSKDGLSFSQLVNCLLTRYKDVTEGEAKEYLRSLIQENILQAKIPLPLTGPSPDSSFVNSLNRVKQNEISDKISTVITKIKAIDLGRSPNIKQYRDIYQNLQVLPIKVEENKLFQTDVYRSFDKCQLSDKLINQLINNLFLIKSLSNDTENVFEDFIKKFNTRYEGQFISLEKLLDDETGISISNDTGYEAPLIAGLKLTNNSNHSTNNSQISVLDELIIEAVSLPENHNKPTIRFHSKFLKSSINLKKKVNLPISFAAMISLYQDNDDLLVKLNGCYGHSAANLLGRFSHLSENLKKEIMAHLKEEQKISPEVIFAEIVHMPEGRPGNVIARPHLREYEIVFLADSILPDEFQIPLSDLYVWVEDAKVKLWSKRLDKQIIPKLSSAHNYTSRSLSAYKFLCMIQHQYSSAPNFSMPESLKLNSFVPRIMIDNIILSEKTWRIKRKEIEKILTGNVINEKELHDLQKKYLLDDNVSFAVNDNVLQINLHNPMMVDVLLSESKNYTTVELTEVLTSQYPTPVKSKDNSYYANEIIIPLLNRTESPYKQFVRDPLTNITTKGIQRRFSPGSSWLNLKIYSGNNSIDDLLINTLSPFIQENQYLFKKWFFIRYGDPDWHLRLRFNGEPSNLYGILLPKINTLLEAKIDSNEIQRIEVFTYDREVERYGGSKIMTLAESLFMADSVLVSKAIKLNNSIDDTLTYRTVLLFTDLFLSELNYNTNEKLELISKFRAGYGDEFNETSQLRKQLGIKYNNINKQIILDFKALKKFCYGSSPKDFKNLKGSVYQIINLINEWKKTSSIIIKKINQQLNSNKNIANDKDSIIGSILHMHNNRMFNAYGREHEFVIYDFLRRYYFSESKKVLIEG